MHPAGLVELAHGGVDDGVAGATFTPCCEFLFIIFPCDGIVFAVEAVGFDVGEVPEDHFIEVAPGKFFNEGVDVVDCLGVFLFFLICGMAGGAC